MHMPMHMPMPMPMHMHMHCTCTCIPHAAGIEALSEELLTLTNAIGGGGGGGDGAEGPAELGAQRELLDRLCSLEVAPRSEVAAYHPKGDNQLTIAATR